MHMRLLLYEHWITAHETGFTHQLVDVGFLQVANEMPFNVRAGGQNLKAERNSEV